MGCKADLGGCDTAAAERVVFDEAGLPAFEGQAMLATNCANTGYCHRSDVTGAERFGAPGGLDFDVQLASTDATLGTADRLAASHANVRDFRQDMLTAVENGTMPPGGAAATEALIGAKRWFDADGNRVPLFADSIEGIEVFRNWLSCGAPVVERTTPHPAGATPIGAVVEAQALGPIEPTFTSIFERVLLPQCGRSCHNPAAEEIEFNRLDLSTRELAYANLVGTAAMGTGCDAMGTRVVAGDLGASLLVDKLSNETPSCGERMPAGGDPISAEALEAVRGWVMAGAMDD